MAYLGISGPSAGDARDEEDARRVARWAAGAGHVVVCGGLGGVMAAAARGADEGGGVSVGLLPGDTRDGATPGLTVALPTGLGELRNGLLVRAVDALLCIGGSWGTLSELALAVRTGVPVVALRTWLPDDRRAGGPLVVRSADDACEVLDRLLAGRPPAGRRID